MRMLFDDEREYLARPTDPDAEGEISDEELALATRLVAQGRIEILPAGDSDQPFTSAMGEKALRIDSLIRQWGFGS